MNRETFLKLYNAVPRGSIPEKRNGTELVLLPAFLREPGIVHGFSTRLGGCSTGVFSSLNLSLTHDDKETVLENYRRFALAAGIPYERMVFDRYEHGTRVLYVTGEDAGRGYLQEPLPPCDGLVTDTPELALVTGHADCMAFYFYDPKGQRIGLCHAGWRGALGRIGSEVVRVMREKGSAPEDILCGVGPSICPECFEVGDDVADRFEAAFPSCPLRRVNEKGKAIIDLWQVALCQFLEAGILPEHVSFMGLCTKEDTRFYSFRREGLTGGMAACLMLKEAIL